MLTRDWTKSKAMSDTGYRSGGGKAVFMKGRPSSQTDCMKADWHFCD